MAIYVDDPVWPFKGKRYCHMMTDGPVEELHQFALRLGLKRAWYQPKSHPHYDVSEGKREEAIRLGAIAVSPHDLVRLCARKVRA